MATYTPIQTVTVTSAVSTVTIYNIPQNYTDLILVAKLGPGSTNFDIRPNGATTGYSSVRMFGNTASATSDSQASNTTGILGNVDNAATTGAVVTSHFLGYSNTNTFKTVLSRMSNLDTGYTATIVGSYAVTTAITSITIWSSNSNTIPSGSTFSIYGLSNTIAMTQNQTGNKAIGGTVAYSGSYTYHAFPFSGTFTPIQSITADILIVAGGGSGSSNYEGAGGGAGGYQLFTSQSLTGGTTYTCTVGAGGTTGTNLYGGSSGGNSQFGAIQVSHGGGKGNSPGANGGSGGGGDYFLNTNNGTGQPGGSGNVGGYTPVEGYGGGTGLAQSAAPGHASGGGGGAGQAGQSVPTAGTGGYGGFGAGGTSWTNYAILDAMGTATGLGQLSSGHYYYAGGGGGGATTNGAVGGLGGGGAGASGTLGANTKAVSGTPNTGGGGGGAAQNSYSDQLAGNGGSGVIIVRYLT